jgi:hypothetical protein
MPLATYQGLEGGVPRAKAAPGGGSLSGGQEIYLHWAAALSGSLTAAVSNLSGWKSMS